VRLPERGVQRLRLRQLAAWTVALAFGLLVYRMADWSAQAIPHVSPLEELAYYPSGQHVRPATLGHSETAADLAWIRAIQYYGEHRHLDNRFDHLYHVFDILTTLAPRFESAYVFGAFALAQEGRNFPQAEALLRKGLESNPRNGRLAFEMGFLYYVKPYGRDLPQAAEYFELAAQLNSQPEVARRFAAFCRQNSGSLAVAYALWQQIRDSSANGYMREIAEKEMTRIREAIVSGRNDLALAKMSTPTVILGEAK
jgi:TPR repeat protein